MRNDGGLQEIAVGAGLVPAHIVRSTMIKSGNAREQSGQGQALPLHPVLSTPYYRATATDNRRFLA